jgi:GT2 family glycosyltransferase
MNKTIATGTAHAVQDVRIASTPYEPKDYLQLIRRIETVVESTLPPDAMIVVVNEGDERHLQLAPRRLWLFPPVEGDGHANYNPANSTAAIAQLEVLRAQGGQFLLLPATAFVWLDEHAQFRQHLAKRYRLVVRREETCAIYDLHEPATPRNKSWQTDFAEILSECRSQLGEEPTILDWHTGLELAASFPECTVFSPPRAGPVLPYLDQTIDLVVVLLSEIDSSRLNEARRVGRAGIVTVQSTVASPEPEPRPIDSDAPLPLPIGRDSDLGRNALSVDWRINRRSITLPTVSIVIPSFNGSPYLESCLHALEETLPHDFQGEILVVDDASTDETLPLLERWARRDRRLKALRNPENVGFITSCNRGASAARGDILVFLNNDTIPLPGWLPPLLRIFEAFPEAGAVGGKLLYPDGRLQEAGSVVFSDGSAANFGRGHLDADDPLVNYVREVAYCSGALLATRRSLFAELGGFDSHYLPAYYEDTDYCFRVRQKGYRVYYQPESAIIHYEGGTSGTDLATGLKRYQLINRGKFQSRWKEILEHQPKHPGRFSQASWHLLVDGVARLETAKQVWPGLSLRSPGLPEHAGPEDSSPGHTSLATTGVPRALICSPLLPEFDRESGSRRMFDLIEFLRAAGWVVSFVSRRGGGQRYIRALEQRGVATYIESDSRIEQLIAAGHFQLAVLAFWHIAESYLPILRRLSPLTRVMVDTVDLHFVRNARRLLYTPVGSQTPSRLDRGYASEMMRELNAYAAADAVLTVSQKEADLVNDLVGDPGLASAVPDCEDLDGSTVPFADRQGVLFVGNFKHPPNLGAVEYLCTEILPRLDPQFLAEHPLSIVGNGLNKTVRQYAKSLPHVRLVGWVPSLLPYFERTRISVIPLRYGAGTKRKLIQALMAGTPTVSTSVGVEGLGLQTGSEVIVADDPAAFAGAIARLLQDEELWQHLANRGRAHVVSMHARQTVGHRFAEVIAATLAKQPKLAQAPETIRTPSDPEPSRSYVELIERIRELVRRVLPPEATVLVVSKGDQALLQLDGRAGWHFPRAEDGSYAGYYPATSAAAIAHLEALRAAGANFLLLPHTALWWLEHYVELKEHLERYYATVAAEENTGVIIALDRRGGAKTSEVSETSEVSRARGSE